MLLDLGIKRPRILECQFFSFAPPIASAKVAKHKHGSELFTHRSLLFMAFGPRHCEMLPQRYVAQQTRNDGWCVFIRGVYLATVLDGIEQFVGRQDHSLNTAVRDCSSRNA